MLKGERAKPASRLERNATLDGLKFVAAAFIVLHHVADYEPGRLGVFVSVSAATALFFFFAASGYLHGAIGGRGPQWWLKRLKRLGIPYAFWSAVYLLWGNRSFILHGRTPFLPNPLLVLFFAGAHGILWFLPMLLVCAIASDALVRGARSRRAAIVICALATLALIWLGVAAGVQLQNVTWYDFALAPLWLLVYLGGMEVRAVSMRPTRSGGFGWLAALAVAAVGLVGIVAGAVPASGFRTVEYALWSAGALLVLLGAVSGTEWRLVAKLAPWRDYLIGIYLSHVIWLGIFTALVPPSRLHSPALWIPAAWAFSFAGAWATTAVLLRFRFTRPFVT